MRPNSFERVRAAAEAAGLNFREIRSGIQASMQTPGHSARDLGTSITYNNDRTLIYCHNGDVEDVLEGLGLTITDLFDSPRGSEYRYPDGRIVRRTPEKHFSQIGNKKGTALYGVDSLEQDGPVYVVEGENDVNTARALWPVAVVSQAQGASTGPERADWAGLAGRDVIIVQDNDKPGYKRAEKVRAYLESMSPGPSSVQVVDVAVGNDLSDHAAAGHGLDELSPVKVITPGRVITLEPFAGMDWDVATWAWEPDVDGQPHGAIPMGSLAIFAGRPGAGKSSAGRHFAAQVSRGTLPGCWTGTPNSVAYLAGEESLKYNVVPSLIAAGADMTRVYRPQVAFTAPDGIIETVALVPEKDMRDLTAQLKAKGTKLVIVDPLMEYMGTDSDIYKNNEVRAKVRPWSQLAEDIDGVVIAIMHLNKSGNGDVVAGINGSSAFGEVARSVFGFVKDPESEEGDRIMSQEKNSIGTEGAAWVYRIEGKTITNFEGKSGDFGTFVMIGDSDRTAGEVLRDSAAGAFKDDDRGEIEAVVLDYLADQGGSAPAGDVLKATRAAGLSDNAVKKARKRIGVKTERRGFGPGAQWVWAIDSGIDAIGSHARTRESMEPMAAPMEDSITETTSPEPAPAIPKSGLHGRSADVLSVLSIEHGMTLRTITGCFTTKQLVDMADGCIRPDDHRAALESILSELENRGLVHQHNNKFIKSPEGVRAA